MPVLLIVEQPVTSCETSCRCSCRDIDRPVRTRATAISDSNSDRPGQGWRCATQKYGDNDYDYPKRDEFPHPNHFLSFAISIGVLLPLMDNTLLRKTNTSIKGCPSIK
jgi:hypothetical protein